MNLFIDTLSQTNVFILFDENRNILTKYDFDVKLNESTRLIVELDEFLKSNKLNYKDIKNTVVVVWPGSFTWIRTLVILINSINFITKNNLTPITYFDLFDSFPIVKASSKRDSFFKKDLNSEIEIILNDDLKNILQNYEIVNSAENLDYVKTNSIPDYEKIIKNVLFQDLKQIQAYYLKKPNIS